MFCPERRGRGPHQDIVPYKDPSPWVLLGDLVTQDLYVVTYGRHTMQPGAMQPVSYAAGSAALLSLSGSYDAQATLAAHWVPYRQYGLVRTSTGFDVYRAEPVP